ncbi:hypothetical protein N665_0213s0010 [Sinapis alba]|nr:hypothetical protein N665_0213s0010 [Sinapis alba]
MTKHVSIHFKFNDRMYSVTSKISVDDITLSMIEDRIYKRLVLDERKHKLKLSYILMVVGCEQPSTTVDDDDLFVYLTSTDKENRRCLFFQLRMKIGPNAITLYIEDKHENQQKNVIKAKDDDDTTEDDCMNTNTGVETNIGEETDTGVDTATVVDTDTDHCGNR